MCLAEFVFEREWVSVFECLTPSVSVFFSLCVLLCVCLCLYLMLSSVIGKMFISQNRPARRWDGKRRTPLVVVVFLLIKDSVRKGSVRVCVCVCLTE